MNSGKDWSPADEFACEVLVDKHWEIGRPGINSMAEALPRVTTSLSNNSVLLKAEWLRSARFGVTKKALARASSCLFPRIAHRAATRGIHGRRIGHLDGLAPLSAVRALRKTPVGEFSTDTC